MKNGLLIWNVVLSLVVDVLLFTAVSVLPGKRSGWQKTIRVKIACGQHGQFRIAYFEMDSVAANFDLVKEVKTELTKKEEEINSEMDRIDQELSAEI